jgi:hypothetical protein
MMSDGFSGYNSCVAIANVQLEGTSEADSADSGWKLVSRKECLVIVSLFRMKLVILVNEAYQYTVEGVVIEEYDQ